MSEFLMKAFATDRQRRLETEADRSGRNRQLQRGQRRPEFPGTTPTARPRTRARIRSLLSVLALGGALVASSAVTALGATTPGTSGAETQAREGAVLGPTSAAAGPGRLAWRKTDLPRAGLAIAVEDVISTGSRFLAVGGGTADSSKPPKARVWTSKYGRVWRSVPLSGLAREGMMMAVTETAYGYVAVGWRGCCPVRAYVWRSPDGRDWKRLPDQAVFKGALMRDVTTHGDDLIAVGCRAEFHCLTGRVWRSTDRGRSWNIVADPPFIPESVVSTGDRLIAVGATSGFDDARSVVATSSDGSSWKVGPPMDALGSNYAIGKRWSQYLVGGGTRTPDGGLGKATVRRTPDGVRFVRFTDPSFRRGRVLALDHVRRRTVVAGVRQNKAGVERPYVWMTVDPESWKKSSLPTGAKALGGIVKGVAMSPNSKRVVAVGSTYDNRPAIWYGKVVRS